MASSEDAFLQGNRAPVRVKTLIKHTSHFQSYIQVTIKAGPARGQHYCMCICQWVSGCPKVGCLDICLYYSPVTSSKAHNLNIQFQSQPQPGAMTVTVFQLCLAISVPLCNTTIRLAWSLTSNHC